MSASSSMLIRRIATTFAVAATGACTNVRAPIAADSVKLRQTGGSIAFADSTAKANMCPLTAASDPTLALNDTTISFARRNGFYDWCIPEYHDDQRFHDGHAGSVEYGPVAHVFAWPGIDTLTDVHFDAGYLIVGLVDLDEFLPGQMPDPYDRLGLKGLHSCLYLMHHHKSWQGIELGRAYFTARMVTPVSNCLPTVADTAGTPLDVAIEKFSDDKGDYPAVGRFIEGQNGHTLIGVQCTDRWCAVGPRSFGSIPAVAHAGEPSLYKGARGVVKGWFDDQVLGVPDGTPKYGIHRKARASLIPDEALGNYKVADFINTTKAYKTVGTAYFVDTPPAGSKYVTVFGFTKKANKIGMRAELRAGAGGKVDTLWYAQVTNDTGGVTSDIITHRMDHSKWVKSVPATARFRWYDKDEDLWFACDAGCCLANGRASES